MSLPKNRKNVGLAFSPTQPSINLVINEDSTNKSQKINKPLRLGPGSIISP